MDTTATIASRLRSESGHTLVELMVSVALLLIVLVASLLVSQVVAQNEPRIRERAVEIQQARVLVERIDRELRLSQRIEIASPSQLRVDTYVGRLSCGGAAPPDGDNRAAILCQVTYFCTAGVCTRTERSPGTLSGGSTQNVVQGLASSTPFSCIPACSVSTPTLSTISWIGVSLSFKATAGEDSITLSGGTNVRNT